MTRSFQTHDGQHYLCAEPDGRVVADRTAVGAWEEWEVEHLAGGQVALRSAHGRYLCAELDGSVVANREHVGPWERWTVVSAGSGVGLRSEHGGFLVAEMGGGGAVLANRHYDDPGPWETFTPSGKLGDTVTPVPLPVGVVRQLSGQVRRVGRSLGDASGPRIVHGCSDFAALPKFHQDRDRTLRELDVVAAHQQYVRVLWRLNGWMWSGEGSLWPNANLSVDPSRDGWYDEVLRGYLTACHERGLRVNLSSGDMNNWSRAQAEDGFRRTAQIAASVSPDLVWLGAVTNELRGTMQGGESDENIRFCEHLLGIWQQHYPWGMRAVSDPGSQDKAGMKRLAGGAANMALIHDVRWEAPDAIRRAFNSMYENFPDDPVGQDEPTGPNGSPPHGPFTRHVYQPIEDHDDLLAIYTMHAITGQASTYFNDPALVSREPLDSTWGFKEIPAAWRAMEIPEGIGQGTLKPGHHADAPLQVKDSGAERADSMVLPNYAIGVISGGDRWRVRAGRDGQATAYTAAGVVWEGRVSRGETLPIAGPTPTIVRFR
jgi:hypothetical protein